MDAEGPESGNLQPGREEGTRRLALLAEATGHSTSEELAETTKTLSTSGFSGGAD